MHTKNVHVLLMDGQRGTEKRLRLADILMASFPSTVIAAGSVHLQQCSREEEGARTCTA